MGQLKILGIHDEYETMGWCRYKYDRKCVTVSLNMNI